MGIRNESKNQKLVTLKNLILKYIGMTNINILKRKCHVGKNQNIFFSNNGNQNIFLEKNHNPPPLFKLNGRSLRKQSLSHKMCCTPGIFNNMFGWTLKNLILKYIGMTNINILKRKCHVGINVVFLEVILKLCDVCFMKNIFIAP
jgi:hypothetical protein